MPECGPNHENHLCQLIATNEPLDSIKDLVKNTSAEELVNYQFNQVLNKADIKELMLNIRDKVLSRKSIL